MTKHTKGDWNAQGIFIAADPGGDAEMIPVGEASYKFVSLDEARANARLMAASPSMLIALKQIREHCPADPDTTREFNVAWALLEAAITKAEPL